VGLSLCMHMILNPFVMFSLFATFITSSFAPPSTCTASCFAFDALPRAVLLPLLQLPRRNRQARSETGVIIPFNIWYQRYNIDRSQGTVVVNYLEVTLPRVRVCVRVCLCGVCLIKRTLGSQGPHHNTEPGQWLGRLAAGVGWRQAGWCPTMRAPAAARKPRPPRGFRGGGSEGGEMGCPPAITRRELRRGDDVAGSP